MTFSDLREDQASALAERLEDFARGRGDERLRDFADRLGDLSQRERDRLSTELMAIFARERDPEAYTLLYELNVEGVSRLVRYHLRRCIYPVDPRDVVQEVFLNIYRYPDHFDPRSATAYRNWTHTIVRNAALRHGQRAQRHAASSLSVTGRDGEEEGTLELEDRRGRSPLDATAEREEVDVLTGAWRLYLLAYLDAFARLAPAEKTVLTLIECDGLSYREAGERMGVRPESLKMRVFRARRKLYELMRRRFEGGALPPRRDEPAELREERRIVAASLGKFHTADSLRARMKARASRKQEEAEA